MSVDQDRLDAPDEAFAYWVDCWSCGGDGCSHHDCGEDCCVCANPEDNVLCDICGGDGGWYGPEKEVE